jgi:hypothetical protein
MDRMSLQQGSVPATSLTPTTPDSSQPKEDPSPKSSRKFWLELERKRKENEIETQRKASEGTKLVNPSSVKEKLQMYESFLNSSLRTPTSSIPKFSRTPKIESIPDEPSAGPSFPQKLLPTNHSRALNYENQDSPAAAAVEDTPGTPKFAPPASVWNHGQKNFSNLVEKPSSPSHLLTPPQTGDLIPTSVVQSLFNLQILFVLSKLNFFFFFFLPGVCASQRSQGAETVPSYTKHCL